MWHISSSHSLFVGSWSLDVSESGKKREKVAKGKKLIFHIFPRQQAPGKALISLCQLLNSCGKKISEKGDESKIISRQNVAVCNFVLLVCTGKSSSHVIFFFLPGTTASICEKSRSRTLDTRYLSMFLQIELQSWSYIAERECHDAYVKKGFLEPFRANKVYVVYKKDIYSR